MTAYEDARIIIEFSRWALEFGLHDAERWISEHMSELDDYRKFKDRYGPDSRERLYPFSALGYYENLGLFYKHGAVSPAMLFDWLDFTEAWENLRAFALSHREASGLPLWTNFEGLAKAQVDYNARPVDQ